MPKFRVLFPATDESAATKDPRVASLLAQTEQDFAVTLTGVAPGGAAMVSAAAALGEGRVSVAPAGHDTLARLMNGLVAGGYGDFLVTLPPGVRLYPEALARFAEAMADPKTAGAFSSYEEVKAEGSRAKITAYPHEGCPTERHEFGFVRVYRAAAVKAAGGFREDLAHAAEYDLDLRLTDTERNAIVALETPLYEANATPPAEGAGAGSGQGGGVLHAPGKGKLGGFSYVFYPADLEAEVTGVFEQSLKRRGSWIDHPAVPVAYPAKPYPVLATVIIPVFNRVSFIGNAIERVLDGTFQDFEVVVIDNGSNDGTQAAVLELVKRDRRVRLLAQQGPSISYALNCGIRAARGKYICQLDSDDEYTPDTLEKMVGHMESHPNCGLAISYYTLMDENRAEVPGIDPITHSGYSRNQILRRDGGGALRVFPKAVLEEMGLYDEENFGNFGEDYDMVLKTGEKYDVDRVHKVLYRYRRHSDNTDVTRDPLMKVRNKNEARWNALHRRAALNKARSVA